MHGKSNKMSSDTEVITQLNNDSPVRKKTKSKLSLKVANFFRSKSQQEDEDDNNKGANEAKCPKIANKEEELSDSNDEGKETETQATSDPVAIPFKSSGACSASVIHEPCWPMTPPETLHSCLRSSHRRRSVSVSEGENLEEKVCRLKCNHVTFSPDTVDPPPRSCSYRKYLEAKSSCPVKNLKHEKHKQKMGQLKKVNLSDFLSASYQRNPITFSMSCDMMF